MAGNLISWFDDFIWIDIRVFITAFVLIALLAGFAVAWRGRQKLQETMPNALVNVIVAGAFGIFVVLAAITLLFLWEVVNSALLVLSETNISQYINSENAVKLSFSVAILTIGYVVSGITQEGIDRLSRRRETLSRHQAQVLYRLTQISVYVVAGATILGVWDIDLTGLLVGAGFLGIVVGMAARQTLGSLLAGFMLMFARPFEIGDWVIIEEQEGIVTDISIVNTRIQTFDGEYVMIPNDTVGGSTIVNRSRKGRLRLEVDVGVDYDADVERAADLAKEAMGEQEDVLAVPSPQVVSKEFGDSAIVLGLRFWIDKPSARRKWRAKTTVINEVKDAFDGEGIKIPYPQRELSGRAETNGFQVAGQRQRVRERGATADGGEPTDDGATDGGTEPSDGGENE
jgi:small conductance mechanosensitive channel